MPTVLTRARRGADAAGARGVGVTVAAGGPDQVFASAAELFGLLATPIRLKIISALYGHEKNVSQLLAEIRTTQPNMSQHLSTLYRAGVLARRRDATQIYYRLGSERAAALCRAVCLQIAQETPSGEQALQLLPQEPAAASKC